MRRAAAVVAEAGTVVGAAVATLAR
jgi:hypothetical protein